MSETKDVKVEARILVMNELRSLSQKFYKMHSDIENKANQKPKPYRLRNGDEFERLEDAQDAYGGGCITAKQLAAITNYFEKASGTDSDSVFQSNVYEHASRSVDNLYQSIQECGYDTKFVIINALLDCLGLVMVEGTGGKLLIESTINHVIYPMDSINDEEKVALVKLFKSREKYYLKANH